MRTEQEIRARKKVIEVELAEKVTSGQAINGVMIGLEMVVQELNLVLGEGNSGGKVSAGRYERQKGAA